MSAPALTRQIAEAGVGVGRLIRYDPRWPHGFDPTTGGFLRSFLGPALALPFYLVVAAMMMRTGEAAEAGDRLLWAAGVSHVLYAITFPSLLAAFARPLDIEAGYASFIIIVNWATFFMNLAAAAASLLILAGRTGYAVFGLVWLVLFAVSLFVTWRAARETLSPEIPVALLMVVLSVGIGVLTDQLASAALRLVG